MFDGITRHVSVILIVSKIILKDVSSVVIGGRRCVMLSYDCEKRICSGFLMYKKVSFIINVQRLTVSKKDKALRHICSPFSPYVFSLVRTTVAER